MWCTSLRTIIWRTWKLFPSTTSRHLSSTCTPRGPQVLPPNLPSLFLSRRTQPITIAVRQSPWPNPNSNSRTARTSAISRRCGSLFGIICMPTRSCKKTQRWIWQPAITTAHYAGCLDWDRLSRSELVIDSKINKNWIIIGDFFPLSYLLWFPMLTCKYYFYTRKERYFLKYMYYTLLLITTKTMFPFPHLK